ncbi:MAG: ThiF family adenylyltransferase [Planctomycetes bacterium]|nr:ThiF family adenylyltransferase [Planctomycetota bacterium]
MQWPDPQGPDSQGRGMQGPGKQGPDAQAFPPERTLTRHARQERFAPIGTLGQERLRGARVLIVGLGALGSHVAESLCRAGLGELILVDRDIVELQNLQRQSLYDSADALAGRPKALAAATRLAAIDPGLAIHALAAEFDAELWDRLPARPQVIVDGTDNFATRLLMNDLAVRDGVPFVHGAVVGGNGRVAVFVPGRGPCLRCLLEDEPAGREAQTCETAGVLEPAVAIVAALQSAACLALLVDARDAVPRGLAVVDAWSGTLVRRFAGATPRPDCASCGTRSFPSLAPGPRAALTLCGRDAVQVRPRNPLTVDLHALADALRGAVDALDVQAQFLRFRADACRFTVFADGRALVFGTGDPQRARALYDRWLALG